MADQTTWLVTGAGRGIGRLLTETLLAEGHRVAATVRDPRQVDVLREAHTETLWVGTLDVSRQPDVRRVLDAAFHELGHIDVVVSNAGYGIFGAAEEIDDEELAKIINTNLLGSMQVLRAALPHLRRQGGGRLLQMSSMAGYFARPGFSAYHATKWGIEGFCEALAQEVEHLNVHVTALAPGRFPTSFYESAPRTDPNSAYEGKVTRGRVDPADLPGDNDKLIARIIETGEMPNPPRRLLLGSDAYDWSHDGLTARLAQIESLREISISTDRTTPIPT